MLKEENKTIVENLIVKTFKLSGLNRFDLSESLFFLSLPICCFLLEIFIVGWKDSSLNIIKNNLKSVRSDIVIFILKALHLESLISIILSFGLIHILMKYLKHKFHFDLILNFDNTFLQYFIFILLQDLLRYIVHFYFHFFRIGWVLHEYHHSAEHFIIINGWRKNYLEVAFSNLFGSILPIVFGIPLHSYLVIIILMKVQGNFKHSRINSDWGFIGRYIFVSPIAHKLHHSIQKEHYDKNFGEVFIFWDRIFGTYLPPVKEVKIGIPENPYSHGFTRDIYISYRRFLKILFNIKNN